MSIEVKRKARVSAHQVFDKSGVATLELQFDDGRTHTFHHMSKEAEILELYGDDMKHVASLFDGGTYVFHNDKLIDYRNSDYQGFIHTDDALAQLQQRVGLQVPSEIKSRSPARQMFNASRGRRNNGVFLGGEWDKFDLAVPGLGAGGEFENRLLFRWSPFSPNIVSQLEVERLICNNGMVAMSPLLSYEVPVIDNWEDNLNVVTMQLKPRVNSVLTDRFAEMERALASVGDMTRVTRALQERRKGADVGLLSPQHVERLDKMIAVVDPTEDSQLCRKYRETVFKDLKTGDLAPGNMKQFDLYNILTEAATHTPASEATANTTQMAINRLVFDELSRAHQLTKNDIKLSDESDPTRAFFSSAGDELHASPSH